MESVAWGLLETDWGRSMAPNECCGISLFKKRVEGNGNTDLGTERRMNEKNAIFVEKSWGYESIGLRIQDGS